ncbi:hypothetical protein SKAU_G00044320 [Synaphobranchus kaupii]|uniref:Poly [ADP-ribose] polymerase 12 n=1 Tax=Synaphobranchus kaupii TaxID=118154 RepID=A0A9Q1G1S6_SYNKA|nr:hypothetical protein SKAU_G00044320 [Synaphobranchus kaupii]
MPRGSISWVQTQARECDGCNNLHLCKFFLYGVCKNNRGRRVCRFGHNLTTEHNARVLRDNDLQDLDSSELCTLLLQNDNTLLPPVCFSYNKGDGEYGNCPDQENCRRLHICDRYLRGTCRAGVDCSRSHDFFEPHPLKTLKERGLPSDLIDSMLSVYQNIQAMKNNDSGNANTRGHNPGMSARSSTNHNKQAVNGPEKTEICMYYVRGTCRHEEKCWKEHSKLPYKWEQKKDFGWLVLPDNEQVEKDFCDPTNDYSQGLSRVHFDTMTNGSAQVRRLSTVSSVLQPTFVLTTEWAWYWEDEFGNWIRYSSPDGGHSASSISSEDLEQRFLEDNSAVTEFTAGSQKYQLSFKDMIQTNKKYGTKRIIRRRPVFISSAEAQTIRTSKRAPNGRTSTFKALPGHWESMAPETGFKRIPLQSSMKEHQEISALFRTTLPGFSIHKIERIQNKPLWEVFQWQKDLMRKNNGGRNVTEKQLFHGTDSKHIDAICNHNFDWRICGTHGTAYGKGSYFARDAKYSHGYTGSSGMRTMFVCRVLVGCYTRGDSSYLRPPSKDGGDSVFYDSCVDKVHDPTVFVVFEKHQVYPEYLIQYIACPMLKQAPTIPEQAYRTLQGNSSSVNILFSQTSEYSAHNFDLVLKLVVPGTSRVLGKHKTQSNSQCNNRGPGPM